MKLILFDAVVPDFSFVTEEYVEFEGREREGRGEKGERGEGKGRGERKGRER